MASPSNTQRGPLAQPDPVPGGNIGNIRAFGHKSLLCRSGPPLMVSNLAKIILSLS